MVMSIIAIFHTRVPISVLICFSLTVMINTTAKSKLVRKGSVWLTGPNHNSFEEVREGTQAGIETETTESSCFLACFLSQSRLTIYSRVCVLTSINLKLETLSQTHPGVPVLVIAGSVKLTVNTNHHGSEYRNKKPTSGK